jgi:hypothetical protein
LQQKEEKKRNSLLFCNFQVISLVLFFERDSNRFPIFMKKIKMDKIFSFLSAHFDIDGGRGELFEKFQQKQKFNKECVGISEKG